MRSALLSALLVFGLVISPVALARGSSHSGSPHAGAAHSGFHSSGSHRSSAYLSPTRAYPGVKRDSHGKIARDPHAKEAFRRTHPCPSNGKTYGKCAGYVVDHIHALKHAGADDPSNMQWQTRQAAKEKDKWE
jgi:hypothetical protein